MHVRNWLVGGLVLAVLAMTGDGAAQAPLKPDCAKPTVNDCLKANWYSTYLLKTYPNRSGGSQRNTSATPRFPAFAPARFPKLWCGVVSRPRSVKK